MTREKAGYRLLDEAEIGDYCYSKEHGTTLQLKYKHSFGAPSFEPGEVLLIHNRA